MPSDILAPVVTWLSAVTVMTFRFKKYITVSDIIKKNDKISRDVASLGGLTSKKYGYDTWSMYSCSHIHCVLNNFCVKMFSRFFMFHILCVLLCVCIFKFS